MLHRTVRAGSFAEGHGSDQDGEEHLDRQHERGEPGRHAVRHPVNRKAYCPRKRVSPIAIMRDHGTWAGQEEDRQRGEGEAQRDEQDRRKTRPAPRRSGRIDAPDERDQGRKRDVTGLHGGRPRVGEARNIVPHEPGSLEPLGRSA